MAAPIRSYWRSRARPVIAEVIGRVGTADPARLARELRAAYPFGEKAQHPYKVWRDEVRLQLAQGPPPDPSSSAQQLTLFDQAQPPEAA